MCLRCFQLTIICFDQMNCNSWKTNSSFLHQARPAKKTRRNIADVFRLARNLEPDEEYFRRVCRREINADLYQQLIDLKDAFHKKPRYYTFRRMLRDFPELLMVLCKGPKDNLCLHAILLCDANSFTRILRVLATCYACRIIIIKLRTLCACRESTRLKCLTS